MPTRPPTFRPKVQLTPERLTARERGYVAAWDRASRAYRRERPFCEYCDAGVFAEEWTTPAILVDHVYPQRRFPGVFWVRALWASSCRGCDAFKQRIEATGSLAALDELARKLGKPTLAELTATPRGGCQT